MLELPFSAEFLIVLCYELRTVVCDYFLWNTMSGKVLLCLLDYDLRCCVQKFVKFPEIAVVVYSDQIVGMFVVRKGSWLTIHQPRLGIS